MKKNTLDKLDKIKIDPNQTIGGMNFDEFKTMMEKQWKQYDRNQKVGGKLKPQDKINKSKGKFAWRSCSDDSDAHIMDEYHRNIKSFDLAFEQATKCMYKRIKDWWKIEKDELEIVGSSEPLSLKKVKWNNKVLSKEDVKKIVLATGSINFHMRYTGKDEEKKSCWQEWAYIHTMEDIDREENELKQDFQKQAQEEADRTGKKAVITNFVGWTFEAEPRKKK